MPRFAILLLRLVYGLHSLALRIFLVVVTLYVVFYFYANSSYFGRQLERLAARGLNGEMVATAWRWGPLPWSAGAIDIRFITPDGHVAIEAALTDGEIDLPGLFTWMGRRLLGSREDPRLHITRADVRGFIVRLDFDPSARLKPKLREAFERPRKPRPPGYRREDDPWVFIPHAHVHDGRVLITTPEWRMELDVAHVDARLLVHDGLWLTSPLVRVVGGRAFVDAKALEPPEPGAPSPPPLEVQLGPTVVEGLDWVQKRFDIARVRGTFDDLLYLDASGGLDFTDAVPRFHGIASVRATGTPKALTRLTRGALDGPFELLARGKGPFNTLTAEAVVRSSELTLFGHRLEQLALAVSLDGAPAEDPAGGIAVHVPLFEGRILGGRARVTNAGALFLPGAPPTAEASVWLEHVDLLPMLAAIFDGPLPAPARGRITGGVTLALGPTAGAMGPMEHDEAGRVTRERSPFAGAAQMDLAMRWPGSPDWPIAPDYRLTGTVAYLEHAAPSQLDTPPLASHGIGAPATERAHGALTGQSDVLLARELRLRSGADELRLDGGLSLATGNIHATFAGGVQRVGGLLQAFGIDGVDGRLRVEEARVGGTLTDPRVDTRLVLRDTVLFGREVGELVAHAALDRGLVSVPRLQARGPLGALQARGLVRLFAAPTASPLDAPSRLPRPWDFRIDSLSLSEFALSFVSDLEGRADIRLQDVTGNLLRPAATLRGRGTFEARSVRAPGLAGVRVRAHLAAGPKTFDLLDLTVNLPGRAEIKAHGEVAKSLDRLTLSVNTNRMRLSALASLLGERSPVRGAVSLSLAVSGDPTDPRLEGVLRVLDLALPLNEGVAGGPEWRVGDAAVAFARARGGVIELTSEHFFPGFALLPGSQVTLHGAQPEEATLRFAMTDFDPRVVFPALADGPMELAVTAEAEVTADLRGRRGRQPWQIDATFPARGLRLRAFDGRFEATNDEPVPLTASPNGVAVPALRLTGQDGSALLFCAATDQDGTLSGALAGTVNAAPLRLLLRRGLSQLEGAVRLSGPAGIADDGGLPAGVCAPELLAAAQGAMRVQGSLRRPLLTGRIDLDAVRVQPRGMGRELILNGALALRPSAPESARRDTLPRQRVEVPRAAPLAIALDDGTATVSGRVDLEGFVPHSGVVRLAGNDLFYNAPKTFNATFNPNLTWTFSDLPLAERRQSRVSGEIVVMEGAYYRSFDTLSRVLGGVGGREQDTPTASLARGLPFLADTELDIQVSGANVNVTSGFTFGTTDLDLRLALRVGGTLANPLIFDRVEVVPGGQIVYRVVRREFEVLRGTLDFDGPPDAPTLELEARTEIPYLDESGQTFATMDLVPLGNEKIVGITVRVQGRYPKIDLDIMSDSQGFDQADLQYLILTGAPRSAGRAQGMDQTITLLTDDLANLARKLLLSAFVDSMTLGVTMAGGIDWGVMASLGRHLKLRTRVVQEGEDRRYRARFEFRITEQLSLEGQLRVNEESNQSLRTYESKLRYRIPLD